MKIEIYTGKPCPYCDMAKELLTRKGVSYQEIEVTHDDQKRQEMQERAMGRRTVPQIFINGKHIGGYDDLRALDQQGKLDDLSKAIK